MPEGGIWGQIFKNTPYRNDKFITILESLADGIFVAKILSSSRFI